jgi:glycosyltransferase involved in cell wall biosynthesis
MVPVFAKHDLIHTNGGIVPASGSPWVGSVENPSSFYGFREKWHEKPRLRARLARLLLSERCRAILPYSEATKEYLFTSLKDWEAKLSSKTHILRPAIDQYLLIDPVELQQKWDEGGPTRFLFVGNHFFDKGGREVLRAFRVVRDEVDCELSVVTSVPQHHERFFGRYITELKNEKKVNFFPTGLSRTALFRLYRKSHCFVLPSYMDQVPFVLLEAMASGLSIIGSNSYAIPEMAISERNGLIVESPWLAFPRAELRTEKHLRDYRREVLKEHNFDTVVEQLIEHMSRMSQKPELCSKFGRESASMVSDGPYSVKNRNEVLSKIYTQSTSTARD